MNLVGCRFAYEEILHFRKLFPKCSKLFYDIRKEFHNGNSHSNTYWQWNGAKWKISISFWHLFYWEVDKLRVQATTVGQMG